MVISPTPEMLELRKVFEKYLSKKKGERLVPNTPPEAIEAHEKYGELFRAEYKRCYELYCT